MNIPTQNLISYLRELITEQYPEINIQPNLEHEIGFLKQHQGGFDLRVTQEEQELRLFFGEGWHRHFENTKKGREQLMEYLTLGMSKQGRLISHARNGKEYKWIFQLFNPSETQWEDLDVVGLFNLKFWEKPSISYSQNQWADLSQAQKEPPSTTNQKKKEYIEIEDDSGFIGVVNAEHYSSFVHTDWEFKQLLLHFKEQTNLGNAAVWSTGEAHFMTLEVQKSSSESKAYRECYTKIKVTNNKLYFVSYNDLTMAAQFQEELIPSKENKALYIELQNGAYNLHIRQLFKPEEFDWQNPPLPCFELIFDPIDEFAPNQFEDVIWWQEDNL